MKSKKSQKGNLFSCFNSQTEVEYDQKQNNDNERLLDKRNMDLYSMHQNRIMMKSKFDQNKIHNLNNQVPKIKSFSQEIEQINKQIDKLKSVNNDLSNQNIKLVSTNNQLTIQLFLFSILEIPLIEKFYKIKYISLKIKFGIIMIKKNKNFNRLINNIICRYYQEIELSNFDKIPNYQILKKETKYIDKYQLFIKKKIEEYPNYVFYSFTDRILHKRILFFQKKNFLAFNKSEFIINFFQRHHKNEIEYILKSLKLKNFEKIPNYCLSSLNGCLV